MATRRRRPTATNTEPTLEALSPADNKAFEEWEKSWEDNAIDITHKVGAEAPELTHEEMLEVAEEREAETQVEETPEEEEQAIEVIMSMALADTFEAIQKTEEEKGLDGFFDPSFYTDQEIRLPAEVVPAKRKSRPNHRVERIITRRRKS